MDIIVSNVAVVPEFSYDGGLQPTEEYPVIQNRIQWLDYSYRFNCSNGAKLYPQLYAAYYCADEDEAFNKDASDSDNATESELEADAFGTDTESEVNSSDADSFEEEDSSDDDSSEEEDTSESYEQSDNS